MRAANSFIAEVEQGASVVFIYIRNTVVVFTSLRHKYILHSKIACKNIV
jgi:hypothetical protein